MRTSEIFSIDINGNIAVVSPVSHLDDSDQEPLLVLLVHCATDGANGPAQHVQVPPGPLSAIHLVVELLCHDAFSVSVVQMGQIDCTHTHTHTK